jgi:hypothetical protein
MRAKFDYDTRKSPNADAERVEMSFNRGDAIIVFDMDDDGFYMGHREATGERG